MWTCKFCSRSADDVSASDTSARELHERLCPGPWVLPTTCALCDQPVGGRTPARLLDHYAHVHEIATEAGAAGYAAAYRAQVAGLATACRHRHQPSAGLGLGLVQDPVHAFADLRREAARYDRLLPCPPTKARLEEYRSTFEAYTDGAVPLAFHASVRDAASPDVVAAVAAEALAYLARRGKATAQSRSVQDSIQGQLAAGTAAASIAVLDGALAAHAPAGRRSAAMIRLQSPAGLARTIRTLPATCRFLYAQMVSSADGTALTPEQWAAIHGACHARAVFLVLDETVSAVRCGAPFAYLRPEYAPYKPSFVLFGETLRACGLAACPDGAVFAGLHAGGADLRRLAAERLDAACAPPPRASPSCDHGRLLRALAVLRQARQLDWAAQARALGASLRASAAANLGIARSRLRGLAALIWLPADGHGHRMDCWLPPLASVVQSEAFLEVLFPQTAGHLGRDQHIARHEPSQRL